MDVALFTAALLAVMAESSPTPGMKLVPIWTMSVDDCNMTAQRTLSSCERPFATALRISFASSNWAPRHSHLLGIQIFLSVWYRGVFGSLIALHCRSQQEDG